MVRATTGRSPVQPSRLSQFITLVRDRFEEAAREGQAPVLVTWRTSAPMCAGLSKGSGRRHRLSRKARFTRARASRPSAAS